MQVEQGAIVAYTPFGGGSRNVRVDNVEDAIKDGQSGFDGVVVDGPEKGMGVWAYNDQVTAVLEPAFQPGGRR